MKDAADQSAQQEATAFVSATGYCFQGIGLVFTLGGCCLWSVSGCFQQQAPLRATSFAEFAGSADRVQIIEMIDMVVTFAGGLGLLAAGIGLQGEAPKSGRWALIVSGVLAATWIGSVPAFVLAGAGVGRIIMAVVLAVVTTILFLLAGNSARLLKLHPPDPDRNVVTDEFLEQQRQRRRS